MHNKCTGEELSSTSIKVNNGNNSKRQTPDQKALYDLAKEAERKAKNGHPISYEEAKILDEWAIEYNVPQHHQAYPGSGEHFQVVTMQIIHIFIMFMCHIHMINNSFS